MGSQTATFWVCRFLRQNFENNVEQRPSNLEVINDKLVLQQRVKKNQEHR
jgi:hypothetical protein